MKAPMPAAIDSSIEQSFPGTLDDLARLIAQPSVASRSEGMQECAELVAELLEGLGLAARLLPSSSFPVVYAEGGTGDKTLICYNHYDVQPEEPIELWDSPPFELVERGGKLYGRGVGDDKGHLVSRLAALQALRDVLGALPCRVKFVVEGGEEIGSPGLPEVVSRYRELFAADACVWETGGVDYKDRPTLTLGARGILYVQFSVRSLSHDAHSGGAHVVPNAAWRLVHALETIKDRQELIRIHGFYDDVRPMSGIDHELFGKLVDADVEVKEKAFLGIDSYVRGRTDQEALEAVFGPTANICGISTGYAGEGLKTVIPAEASAKMDFRLVPDQDPNDIFRKLRAHLDHEGFGDVEVQLLAAESPAVTPYSDPFVQLTAATAEEVYDKEVAVHPLTGGSGPLHAFRHYLGVPIVTLGVGYPEGLPHAPNENIRIRDFILGTRHMAHLIQRWSQEGT